MAEGSTVRLRLESRPQTLTIVRGMLGGVAELLSIDPELLDDLKTSVSEACNNVVLHAYGGEPGPMEVGLFVSEERFSVRVVDEGVGMPAPPPAGDVSQGIGLSVIRALTEDVQFSSAPDGGTEVRMDFSVRRDGRKLFEAPPAAAGDAEMTPSQDGEGEVIVSLSPVTLLPGVLGRLARTLAATAHFSLDRFSDVYLVTDTLAAHASTAAEGQRIEARLRAQDRRLELVVGPFRKGTGSRLDTQAADHPASPLVLLSDQVSVQEAGEAELLRVVVIDHRR
ncbi:MAG TPA: ATP-binding protein [Solirubrobacteraceae bacterium]|jgi:serine/threonine-protein kinase RsbW|nr:ATP-binding protein [Solirubrobacteraceae bacterium]